MITFFPLFTKIFVTILGIVPASLVAVIASPGSAQPSLVAVLASLEIARGLFVGGCAHASRG